MPFNLNLKKNLFFLGAVLIFFFIIYSFPLKAQGKDLAHRKIKKESAPVKNLSKDHNHTDRSKQAACPICNIRLLMEEGYREITIEEIKKLQKNNEAFILINTLPLYYYRKEHIPNSINIPLEDIEHIAPKLFKKDAKIIVYCLGYHCKISSDAAKKFVELGFTNVFDYKGGIKEWREKGNRVSGLLIAPGKK
jgi:rhodanese-related sulfurtransferase